MEELKLLDEIEDSIEEIRTGDRPVSEFEVYRNIRESIEKLRSLILIRSMVNYH